MSLILEALRKSESERQLGQLPGLMSPVIPVRRRRPYRRWLMLTLVLAIGLGGGWWLALRLAAPPAPSQPLGAAEQAAPASAKVTSRNATGNTPAPLPDSAAALPASPPVVPPAAAPRPVEPPLSTSPAAATTPPPVSSVVEPAPPPATPAPVATPAPAVSPGAAEPDKTVSTPASTVADSVPLSQMPAAQRASLPALKLSVHVFADDPARRFAIIDGRRHVEGDELGSGVRLREIQRHGVLLDIGGQPWLLERPR